MPFEVVSSIPNVRDIVRHARRQELTIGLVPTMGALHAGHGSLIRSARQETGFVVVSIFVNPTQFGPNEDFHRYPRALEEDLELCRAEGVDLVFTPAVEDIFPSGYCTYVEVQGLQDVLCGRFRPGHFRGVATVVLKLFSITQPDVAYFGQKDAQQARIIAQMVKDLDLPIKMRICPVVRESDGLALSSRNRYLSVDQRKQALVLYHALQSVARLVEQGVRDPAKLRGVMVDLIERTPGAILDYAEIVEEANLQPPEQLKGKLIALLAVKFGETRLIDNTVIEVD